MVHKRQDPATCRHDWRMTRDWEGDRTIPNGRRFWNLWICRRCGEETEEEPSGWEDPRELHADDLRAENE